LKALKAHQQTLALSDAQFAAQLGIHRSTWVLIKNGIRPLNLSVLGGIARAFPALDAEILNYLRTRDQAGPTP